MDIYILNSQKFQIFFQIKPIKHAYLTLLFGSLSLFFMPCALEAGKETEATERAPLLQSEYDEDPLISLESILFPHAIVPPVIHELLQDCSSDVLLETTTLIQDQLIQNQLKNQRGPIKKGFGQYPPTNLYQVQADPQLAMIETLLKLVEGKNALEHERSTWEQKDAEAQLLLKKEAAQRDNARLRNEIEQQAFMQYSAQTARNRFWIQTGMQVVGWGAIPLLSYLATKMLE